MNRRLLYLVFVSFLLLPVAGHAGGKGIPDVIPSASAEDSSPIWVSMAEATDSKGQFKREMFRPVDAMMIERYIDDEKEARAKAGLSTKSASGGCESWTLSPGTPIDPDATLADLIKGSKVAVIGTVTDHEQGFYHGRPNSLLEIRVERILKAPPGFEEVPSLYSTYPEVEMPIGNEVICLRSDRFPERPEAGKGIMIFASNIPDWEPLVLAPNSELMFFEGERGEVVFPKSFGEILDAPTWPSMIERAEDAFRLVRKPKKVDS